MFAGTLKSYKLKRIAFVNKKENHGPLDHDFFERSLSNKWKLNTQNKFSTEMKQPNVGFLFFNSWLGQTFSIM
jgi:hypothetical protein